MKKNVLFNLSLICSLLLSSFAPLTAQESSAPTFAQRISRIMPRPSLPSWAKGPGFEAAKKWLKAGRDESVLSNKEKRAFRRFKKKFAIGAIITAVVAALGSTRWYQIRQQAAEKREQEAARSEADIAKQEKAATTLQAAIRGAGIRKRATRDVPRRRQVLAQERVEQIFNAGSEETQDLSHTPDNNFPTVLAGTFIEIGNSRYAFNDVKEGRGPRLMEHEVYFRSPTITHGTEQQNMLSFPVSKRQGLHTNHAGKVEIVEAQNDGTYTYKAYYQEEGENPQAIPIKIEDGIIQVKLLGDLRYRDNKLYKRITTTDRINYFG